MSKEVLPIHGDQHCPGGPDPIPCLGGYPYVFRKKTTVQSMGAGVTQYVSWDSSDYDEADGHFTNIDATTFNIIGPGVFDFLAAVKWPAFNSTAMLQMSCDAFGWFPVVYGKGALYTSGGSLLDSQGAMYMHFQARLPSGTSPTALIVAHENGSAQSVSEAFIRVARIGDWSGAGVGGEADFAFL